MLKLTQEDLAEWRAAISEVLVAGGVASRGLLSQPATSERHAGALIKMEELQGRFIEEYDLDPEYRVVVAPDGTLLQGEKLGIAYADVR